MMRAIVQSESDDPNWQWVSDIQVFADVHPDGYMSRIIETAYQHGIITGYPCGGAGEPCGPPSNPNNLPYFRPNNSLTRGQAAKVITLAEKWNQYGPQSSTFTDVPIGSTFWSYVETANFYQVMTGYKDPQCSNAGTGVPCFLPNNPVYRAQATKFTYLSAEGNFKHSQSYSGSNNWSATLMEPRGFLLGSVDASQLNVYATARSLQWSGQALSWLENPSRITDSYIVFHAFYANTQTCAFDTGLNSYSYSDFSGGTPAYIRSSESCLSSYSNEVRLLVDPYSIAPGYPDYNGYAGFFDVDAGNTRKEVDIDNYYEGGYLEGTYKDNMRKFCFYNFFGSSPIGWPDAVNQQCHQ